MNHQRQRRGTRPDSCCWGRQHKASGKSYKHTQNEKDFLLQLSASNLFRRNAENFKSDESKRGIEPNQISKRIRYQKQTRIFAVFQRKLSELQPCLSERKGHPNS
uniref:(northern house mosquito) hypothetical protein n=1 Tax=Culex pipiens TaxID=7175 RepID=A0A8D8A2R0_CULPI